MKKVIKASGEWDTSDWAQNYIQGKIDDAVGDLRARQSRGDKNLIDTYEYGFIDACRELNRVYDLGLEVPKGIIK